jgi:hypothetical protein
MPFTRGGIGGWPDILLCSIVSEMWPGDYWKNCLLLSPMVSLYIDGTVFPDRMPYISRVREQGKGLNVLVRPPIINESLQFKPL